MEKRKILIIDDEEKFCQMVKRNLEKTGQYEVYAETTATQCLATAQSVRPDLILLDLLMPVLEGSEVSGKLKNDGQVKNIPIVFLSGTLSKGQSNAFVGFADGWPVKANPALSKPVSTKDLIACIEKNLMKKELFRRQYDKETNRKPKCKECNQRIELLNDADIELVNEAGDDPVKRYAAGDKTALENARLIHQDCDFAARQR